MSTIVSNALLILYLIKIKSKEIEGEFNLGTEHIGLFFLYISNYFFSSIWEGPSLDVRLRQLYGGEWTIPHKRASRVTGKKGTRFGDHGSFRFLTAKGCSRASESKQTRLKFELCSPISYPESPPLHRPHIHDYCISPYVIGLPST